MPGVLLVGPLLTGNYGRACLATDVPLPLLGLAHVTPPS